MTTDERVAKAIADAKYGPGRWEWLMKSASQIVKLPTDELNLQEIDVYRAQAKAAIAALDAEPSLEDALKEAAALGREGVSINYSDDAVWGPWYAVIEYDAFSFDDGQGETAAEAIRNAVKAAGGE